MIRKSDEGWAWVVLLSIFLTALNTGIASFSFGVLNVALLQRYEQNVATTALIGSVFLAALFLTAPIASMIINIFSCRTTQIVGGTVAFVGFSTCFFVDTVEMFSLTYGLIAGSGMSLCYTVCHVIISFHFKKFLGLAFGLTIAAIGLGLLASGPVIQFLIDKYGLHGTLLIIGSMTLNNVTFALLMFPTKEEMSVKEERNKKDYAKNCCNTCMMCQSDIFKIKVFVILLASDFIYSLPYSIILYHLPNISVMSGSSANEAALLNTALGIGSTINRLITGMAISPEGVDPLFLYVGFNGILGILSFTFPLYYETYKSQYIFCLIHGAYTGGINAIRSPLYLQIVGLRFHSTAVGLMFFVEGIAFLIGPPFAGWIVDVTGSYEISFYITGSCFIAAFFLALSSTIWRNMPKKRNTSVDLELLETQEQKPV